MLQALTVLAATAAWASAAIPQAAWNQLQASIAGTVVLPSSALYANDTSQWNSRFRHYPAGVVFCNDTNDVAYALKFSQLYTTPFSVRAGGHNVEGWAVCDGCVLIDVSRLNRVSVDVAAAVAVSGVGISMLSYDNQTVNAVGLLSPSGICPSVGMAGFVQGGGIGWTSRHHGLLSDTVLRYTVVLWNGTVVSCGAASNLSHADIRAALSPSQPTLASPVFAAGGIPVENSDLFWALRGGGGGNFGIVTEATLALDHAPPELLYAEFQWDAAHAPNVTELYLGNTDSQFCFFLLFIRPQPGQVLVLMQGLWYGDMAAGKAALEPFKRLANATGGQANYFTLSYFAAKARFSGGLDLPVPSKSKSAFVPYTAQDAFVQEGVKIILDAMAAIPDCAGPYSSIYLNHFGGAINAVPPSATAFAHRSYISNFVMDLHWHADDVDAATAEVLAWSRDTYAAMAPYISHSVYVNYLDRDLCNSTLTSFPWYTSYYEDNYDRLLAIKRAYDPQSLFTWPQAVGSSCNMTSFAAHH